MPRVALIMPFEKAALIIAIPSHGKEMAHNEHLESVGSSRPKVVIKSGMGSQRVWATTQKCGHPHRPRIGKDFDQHEAEHQDGDECSFWDWVAKQTTWQEEWEADHLIDGESSRFKRRPHPAPRG